MVFLRFSYDYPMKTSVFHHFPMVFPGFSYENISFSTVFPWFSYDFLIETSVNICQGHADAMLVLDSMRRDNGVDLSVDFRWGSWRDPTFPWGCHGGLG